MTVIVIRDLGRQLLYEMRPFGPRTHEVHLAFQDVPELRYLIDTQFSDDLADTGHAFVVCDRPDRVTVLLRVRPHRAELDNVEYAPALADAFLAVKNRAS